MALSINTNVASLNAQRNLSGSQGKLATSMQRLSSGLRINSAKDDAAGLGISDRMTSQIRGMNQAQRNANDGISLAQTAEGAMQETTNLLQRMRELAVQSANGTNTSSDRTSINDEFSQLQSEIQRIADNTAFNGVNIIDGTFTSTLGTFQVGANSGQTIAFAIASMGADALSVASGDIDVLDASAAGGAITAIDTAIGDVDTARGALGAIQNRFESTISNLANVSENLSAARGRIMDTDIAQESSNMTKYNIMQQAGVSILAQANQAPNLAMSLLQ